MQRLVARGAKITALERCRERAIERGVELLQPGGQRVPRLHYHREKGRLYSRRISEADREIESHGDYEGAKGGAKRRKLASASSSSQPLFEIAGCSVWRWTPI